MKPVSGPHPHCPACNDEFAHDLAAWLDEEYRRLSLRPDAGDSYDAHNRAGRLLVLAEVAAIIRSGTLPRHSPVRMEWEAAARRLAPDDEEIVSAEGRR